MITLLNIDCMSFMATQPDNAFDLAIVDPPYFPGPDREDYYCNFSVNVNKPAHKQKKYKPLKNWDIPGVEYYKQLLRVSKHQINLNIQRLFRGWRIRQRARGGSTLQQHPLGGLFLFGAT